MFIVQRIDSVCTGKHTGDALVHESLTLGTMFYTVQIFVYSFLLIRGDYLFYIIAFGSQYHKSNPENRIGTRRKYGKLHIGIHHLKLHFGSLGTTYPVLLGLFKRICPIYFIQTFQQTLSVCRYPKTPLTHHFLFHRISPSYGNALAHLVVGKHGSQLRTPVYHRITQIGNAVIHQYFLLFFLRFTIPFFGRERKFFAASCIHSFCTCRFESLYKFFYGTSLLFVVAIITIEHLYERPLSPFIIFGIASTYFAAPIITKAYLVQLLAITIYVLFGRYGRVLSCLYGILLGRKTVCIIPHRVKNVKPLQSFISGINIGGYISQRVTYVQTCSRRIGKHIQYVILGLALIFFYLINMMIFPILLPLLFYFFEIIFHDKRL